MRRASIVVSLVVVVVWSSWAWSLTPVKVLGGPEDQVYASANETYLGWSQNSTAAPKHYNAWVMDRSTSKRSRINPKGTVAWFGSFVAGANKVLYQSVSGGDSDLKFYDIDASSIGPVPRGINTRLWEWSPRTTGSNIAFMRWDPKRRTQTAFVWVKASKTIRKLASVGGSKFLQTESAGDRYVTYQRCDATTCKVSVYDVQTKTTRVIPNPPKRIAYASSLDEARDRLYFGRSGFGCGLRVVIQWVPISDLGATPVTLASMPDGIDVGSTSLAFLPTEGRVDLMFDRDICTKRHYGYGDMYMLEGVDSLP